MTDSFELARKSFSSLYNNPKLLYPALFSLVVGVGIGAIIIIQILLGILLFTLSLPLLILFAIIMGLIDIAMILSLSAFVTAMQYAGVHEVITKGKTSYKSQVAMAKILFNPTLRYLLVRFVIFIVPLTILAALSYLVFTLNTIAGIIAGIVSLILYMGFLIIFYVMNVYNYPILVTQRKGGLDVIRTTMSYSQSHTSEVVLVSVFVIVLYLAVTITAFLVNVPAAIIDFLAESYGTGPAIGAAIVSFIFQIVSTIIQVLGNLLIALFIFYSYFDSNPQALKRQLPVRKQASQGSKKSKLLGGPRQ